MTKISEDDKSGRQDVPKISSPSGADSLAQEGPLENLDKLQISPTTNAPASSDDVVPPHRSHDPQSSLKRSDPFQFGSRYLLENDDVFEFNAWDHVEMDQDYIDYAESQLEKQREKPVSDIDRSMCIDLSTQVLRSNTFCYICCIQAPWQMTMPTLTLPRHPTLVGRRKT